MFIFEDKLFYCLMALFRDFVIIENKRVYETPNHSLKKQFTFKEHLGYTNVSAAFLGVHIGTTIIRVSIDIVC